MSCCYVATCRIGLQWAHLQLAAMERDLMHALCHSDLERRGALQIALHRVTSKRLCAMARLQEPLMQIDFQV